MGEQVQVKEVNNFAFYDKNAINICFTSTQKLHMDMNFPKENSPTIDDFEDDKIVLISDESHHINTVTKGLTKSEKTNLEENAKSWEYTIEKIFRANRDNALLEFTATADLKDPNVEKNIWIKLYMIIPYLSLEKVDIPKTLIICRVIMIGGRELCLLLL